MPGIIRSVISRFSKRESDLNDLLKKVARKDQSAFEKLYRATSPNVFALAGRMLNNKPDAEEITYDVFLQIWNSADQYDSSKSSPLGWILMITRTRSIDRIRKESKSKYMDETDLHQLESPVNNPEKESSLSEERVIVINAISMLTENEKKMIELAFYHGLTQSEISEYSKQPLGTVKTTIRRSLMILRDNLKIN